MFFDWFGTLEIECDATAYSIVRACRKLGFHAPEDVRWCQVGEASSMPRQRASWLSFRHLKSWFGKSEPRSPACVCGAKQPELESYSFTLVSGRETRLLLGQCRRCRTIFWKDAPSGLGE